jgi:hypothetical protein
MVSVQETVVRLPIGDSLTLFLLEGESVLYAKRSRSLLGLDGPATVLLLKLAEGESCESLSTGLDPAAQRGVRELADLVAGRDPLGEGYHAELACGETVSPALHDAPCHRLLTTRFTISCGDATLCRTITDTLGHLAVPQGGKIDLGVGIVPAGDLWHLCLNGELQGDAVPAEMVLPKLQDFLRRHAYQRIPFLLAVHAAVVSDGQRTVIFPGQSGAGKSTLAATMLARGYRLLSDEVALINETGELMSIPLGLGLKSGSWPLLEKYFPSLATTAEHVRWDGSRVRYLQGDDIVFAEGEGSKATHICFPVYCPHGSGGVEQLSPVTALLHLTAAGYQVRDLHEESAARILSWLLQLSCSIISYASSAEALRLLDGVLNTPSARSVSHGG